MDSEAAESSAVKLEIIDNQRTAIQLSDLLRWCDTLMYDFKQSGQAMHIIKLWLCSYLVCPLSVQRTWAFAVRNAVSHVENACIRVLISSL